MDNIPELKNQSHQEYHHGNLRKALVDAALGILKEEGIQLLSLRGVARRAGVSPTAPYSHFKDKTCLLAAVARKGYLAMGKSMELEAMGTITAKERMLGMARGYVKFAIGEKELFQLMFGNEIGPFDRFPDLEKAAATCQDLLVNGGGGALFVDEEPLAIQPVEALAAWSLVHGLATLLIDGKANPESFGISDHDSLVDSVASLLILAE